MRILVTGGCGFIGSNFIRHILRNYHSYKIVNLDKLTYCGNLNNLRDVEQRKNYKFVKGDICDPHITTRVMKDCDVIINFAAESHVDRSIKDSGEFIKTNFEGVKVLLDAAKRLKVRRFLHISTDEVYGDIKGGFSKEDDPLLPNSPYAATKAAADLLCKAYIRTYNMPIIITRSSNNFGPYQHPEKVIPLFITNILENKPLPIYGNGKNIRDWIYVLDNCSAIDFILHKGKPSKIYNISGGNQIQNIEMAKMILVILGKDKRFISFVTDRPGHDRRYALDSKKIKMLGWRGRYNFNTALRLTIDWYVSNKWWWQPLKHNTKTIKW